MSTLSVATVKSLSSAAPVFQNSSGTEKGQLAKAWIRFNGTGTIAITDSFNISSITDKGTGNYGINYTNAMSNANYSIGGFSHRNGSGGRVLCHIDTVDTATTTAYEFVISGTLNGQNVGLANVDVNFISVQIFGD